MFVHPDNYLIARFLRGTIAVALCYLIAPSRLARIVFTTGHHPNL